jgi:hypothetical protein
MLSWKKTQVRCISLVVAVALLVGACGGQNFTTLTTDAPVAELPEGIVVSTNPARLPANFGVQLAAIAPDTFLNGQAGRDWVAPLAALPAYLRLQSSLFQLKSRGESPDELFVALRLPADADAAASPSAYDLYAWNGAAWEFLPSQQRGGQLVAAVPALPPAVGVFVAAAPPPLAFVTIEPGHALTQHAAEAVNGVLLGGVLAQADGSLGGQVPGVDLGGAFAVYPIVRDEPGVLAGLLAEGETRTRHMQALLAFVHVSRYDGLVLDYAGVTPELAPGFAQFVHDLAAQMHGQGKSLFVQVPPATVDGSTVSTGGYDWRALGASADALFISMPADPAAYGNGWASNVLKWAVSELPRSRVRLLTSALSVESVDGQFGLIDQAAAIAPLGQVVADAAGELHAGEPVSVKLSGKAQALAYDSQAFAASFAYTDDNGRAHTLWLTSADTLRQRLALAEAYNLGGIVIADLLAPGFPPELLNAVTQYKVAMQAAALTQADVLWTVKNNAGTMLALATAQPNQPYVYVASSPGDYEFSANLQHGGTAGLGSVAVRVAAQPTAVIEATETAVPATAVVSGGGGSGPTAPSSTAAPTATRAPSGGFVPPPPIGAGTFQLGGQVPGFISHPAQMQQAGMTWVKFQVRGGGHDMISAAKGAGFKVLLSVIGDKARATDPAYWDEYAGWVASLAAAGADAIEVWNEPNIDHEWPAGQISAAAYTQMLAKAYTAIKGANGGTIVISGGPAPTGAEGAFPGRVVNDDRFMREMAAAGAANYMDCIGIHYNTGTTSPNATSGATLSGYHYSYYFWPMVDTYWNAFGGSRPLCFTELGYLSGDGYPPIPPGFAWASHISLGQHAQWLAEAASLAGNSGKVRLMIVWNVDFTHYSADPQAGYAIVRPDGSCPACAALGAVVR